MSLTIIPVGQCLLYRNKPRGWRVNSGRFQPLKSASLKTEDDLWSTCSADKQETQGTSVIMHVPSSGSSGYFIPQPNKGNVRGICALFIAPLAFLELQITWQWLRQKGKTGQDARGRVWISQLIQVFQILLPKVTVPLNSYPIIIKLTSGNWYI